MIPSIFDAKRPYIVWENNGCEGWHPNDYATIEEALLAHKYGSEFIITKIVEFRVTEKI